MTKKINFQFINPMKKLTDITIILDRSGSMDTIKNSTIEGFNTFIKKQKKGDFDTKLAKYKIVSMKQYKNDLYKFRVFDSEQKVKYHRNFSSF